MRVAAVDASVPLDARGITVGDNYDLYFYYVINSSDGFALLALLEMIIFVGRILIIKGLAWLHTAQVI